MKVYTQAFDSALGQIKQIENEIDITYRSSVNTVSDLPSINNVQGDLRIVLDTDHYYVYISGEWIDQGVFDSLDLLQERLMQGLS